MRVQCPDCAAAYEVPEHLLAGHKALRCARCGAEWMPNAPAPAPTKTAPVLPLPEAAPRTPMPAPALRAEPKPPQDLADGGREAETEREPLSAMQRLALPVERPRRAPWAGIAWIWSLLVLAALAWGAVTWRADVMHAWPPSARAYAALGLAPTSP